MVPLPRRIHGRHIAALALVAAVLGGGVYRMESQRAQVGCVPIGGVVCPAPDPAQLRLVNLPADVFPGDHIAADVNGDGHLDVAVLNNMGNGTKDQNGFYNGIIDVMLGDGTGAFQPKVAAGNFSWNDGGGIRAFDVLDADQDGDGDIIVHTYPDVYLLTNNGMTFTRTKLFSNIHANLVVHGDANGDGDPDLLMGGYRYPANGDNSRVFIAYGDLGTAFDPPVGAFPDIHNQIDTLRFADMDGDGDDDVLGPASRDNGWSVRMYRNKGDGTFDPSVELFWRQANNNIRRLIVTEASGDDDLDIVVEENENVVTVLVGDGNGGIERSTIIPLLFKSYLTAVADPSGDGIPDIITGASQTDEGARRRLWFAEGNGDGTYKPNLPFVTWNAPLTAHDYPTGAPYYYENVWHGSELEMADYNEDGRMDLSMPHATYSDSVTVFLFRDEPVTPCVDEPPVMTCANVCGDGVRAGSEQCDDGNTVNTDACSNICRTPTCTDGIAQVGENCGVVVDPICDIRFCGNGVEDPGEDCDPFDPLNGEMCDPMCRIICTDDSQCPSGECAGGTCRSLCGNGVVDPPLCVSDGGSLECPPAAPGDMKIVNLPGDVFATSHASGDLNKDGKIDIVVAYYMGSGTSGAGGYTGTLQAYINKGNGEFEPKRKIGTFQWNNGGGSRGLDVFDADGDGDADVAVYDGSAQGIVVLRNDNMTFTRTTVQPNQYAFYLSHGDVNRDGDPELGSAGFTLGVSGTYSNSVFLARPGVAFGDPARLESSTGYDTFKFADMNNDGDKDVVTSTHASVSGSFGYAVHVYMSNGDGTFADREVMYTRSANPNVTGLVIADMNNDGKLDVVLGENSRQAVVVLGDGQGGSISSTVLTFDFHPRLIAAADPTADGIPDVVFGSGLGTEGRNLWYAEGKGDGTYEAPVRFVTVSPPASGRPPFSWNSSYYYNFDLRTADYDGDGRLDLSMTHALSSDSATVILMRSSIDSCTQLGANLTCSMGEECDDGAVNGQPGKCTRRCTYCGNGQIDTVNGVAEACDLGALNGEPGSTCTVRCTMTAIVVGHHTECRGNQCVMVEGIGTNGCTNDAHCCDPLDPSCKHMACIGVGACAEVSGPGLTQCNTGADCCDPLDPACTTFQCDFLDETCGEIPGPGIPQCTTDNACTPFHFSCEGNQCAIQPGDGPDTCQIAADCGPPRHLACVGVGQCAMVEGEGPNGCLIGGDCCDPLDPTCKHVSCLNNACVEQNGPGINNCDADADCAPCPATDPFCHSSCDVLIEQCLAVSDPGEECATHETCANVHLTCENRQCVVKPGDGPDTCEISSDCDIPCNSDNICTADESCLCLDCIDANRCLQCDNDGLCESGAGESCGCGDCVDNDACLAHTVCDADSNACQVVLGPGTNECSTAADCATEQHLACTGVGACTIVDGPGWDTCTLANAEEVCCDPLDPTCTHRQCNPFTQSCIVIDGPAMDQCETGEDCTQFHSVCSNSQCIQVEGEGESECLDSSMCISHSCGNGTQETGEDCDEGPNNRATPPASVVEWYCNAVSCTRSVCFNGGDDDGDQLPDIIDAGCWRYTIPERANRPNGLLGFLLGQGQGTILTPLIPEVFLAGKGDESCPAGTMDRGDLCLLTCDPGDICPNGDICPEDGVCLPTCGNEIIDLDLGEECDDGNLIDDDACNNQCRLTCVGPNCPRCGDGIHQQQLGEQCDEGGASATCSINCAIICDGPEDCIGTCNLTTNQCIPPVCGDGKTNQEWERCDDGDIDHTNACNNQCQPTCNGDADCESGKCDKPRQVCVPLCGNGRVDSTEQCDDGNKVSNDDCTNQCERHCSDDSTCDCDEERGVCRALCGNGRLDPGEGCDDGNREDRDQCSNRCEVRCRPGTVCPDNQACPQNGVCPLPGICGDGEVNPLTEQCDDGNQIDGDGCSNACVARCSQNLECPSGLLCLGEQCVECSNSLQCDGGFCVEGKCRQALPICGNGLVEVGEACDDGNADDADGCTVGCLFPINHACVSSAQCQTHRCQDSVCQPCADAGQCPSGLRCSQGNCLFGPLQCGDGIVQAGEACDDANLNEQDQCTTACLKPFGEACGHASECSSTICSAGSCTPCRADGECSAGLRCAIGMCLTNAQMAMIPNICGNGFLEGDEACDDGNGAYGDGCTPLCTIGNSPSRLEVAANVTVQMPFMPGRGGASSGDGAGLHGGAAGGPLSDTGPATVAIMAAGAAAGTAWVRRRFKDKRR